MISKPDYIKGTLDVLLENMKEKKEYKYELNNKRFIVYPNVYSPKYFQDTKFFVDNLIFKKGKSFLEMGCGTGIVSVFASLWGASNVTLVDINSDAVKNSTANIKRHGLCGKMKVLESDLFSSIKKGEKFDSIFWNVPFVYVKRRNLSLIERSVFDTNYESIERFIEESKIYLNENGRLLIGFSETLGKYWLLKNFLDSNNFTYSRIARSLKMEHNLAGPFDIELIEARL